MKTRRTTLAVLLAVALAFLAFAIVWRPAGEVTEAPETDVRVMVVAVDGLDWFLVGRYIEPGRLPALERLLRSSITGEVVPDRPVLPHVGWTRFASGRPPTDAELERLEGDDPRLFGAVPEIARIAADAGVRTIAIGWPGAWPVGPDAPTVVAPYSPATDAHEASLAPALFGSGAGETASDALAARISKVVDANLSRYAAGFGDKILDPSLPVDRRWSDHVLAARWSYLADSIVADLAAALIAEEEPQLSLVYLGGLDAVGHRFIAPASPELFHDMPASFARYEDVLPNYYTFVDETVERFLRLADDGTIFVVCSAYGTHPVFDLPGYSGGHANGPPGVLVVRGQDLERSHTPFRPATIDFAPTLLALVGAPIPTDMDGRLLVEMMPHGHLERFPPEYATIPAREPGLTVPSGIDQMERKVQERLSRLRADLAQ